MKLTCQIPDLDRFVIRGTIPVKKGIDFDYTRCPFSILDQNGNVLATQWSQVSRHPNGQVAVAKLAAVVNRGDLQVGSFQDFEIIENDHAINPPSLDSKFIESLRDIRIRATDLEGNQYSMPLAVKSQDYDKYNIKVYEAGDAYGTLSGASVLVPEDKKSAPYEYLGGMQFWGTIRSDGHRVVSYIINWHNALASNAISDIYFRNLELVIPEGWGMIEEAPNPEAGEPYVENGQTVYPLIVPQEDGSAHTLPQRFERSWRMHIYAPKAEQAATLYSQQWGWATTEEWRTQGHYFHQFGLVPEYDQQAAFAEISQNLQRYFTELAAKFAWGSTAFKDTGYFNPAGVPYGGESGGFEINQWDGVLALNAKSPIGLQLHLLLHRRYSDRSRAALYEYSGLPIVMDNYLNEDETTPWEIFNCTFKNKNWPFNEEDDDAPFEFDEVDTTYVDAVKAQGKAPVYEEALLEYDPIDHQHEIRATKDMKVLVWLDNDPLARLHLRMRAEVCRMCYYEGPNGRWHDRLNYALDHPGLGGPYGRGEGWVSDTIGAYYAVASNAERERYYSWIETTREILTVMQMANGHIQRAFQFKIVTDPPFNNQYSVAQPYEHCYIVHGCRGLWKSVYDGVDPNASQDLIDFITKAAIGTYTFAWTWTQGGFKPAGSGPWFRVAVGDLNPESQPFLTHADHPEEQYEENLDNNHVANMLAYGLDLFQNDPFFRAASLFVISQYVNGKEPLQGLLDNGLTNVKAESYLLALLQQG